jgi:hypothetical protein
MTVNSELNIYFHMPGQILRTTNINRLSLANRANTMPFTGLGKNFVSLNTDWDIDLNIETVDLSGINEPDCIEKQESYDQCILSQFLQNGNNSGFSELFLCDVIPWSSKLPMVPLKVIEEYFATIMSPNAVNKCAKSCSYIQVEFDQSANRKLLKMQFGFVTLSVFFTYLKPPVTFYYKLISKQPGSIENCSQLKKSCFKEPKKELDICL